MNGFTLLMILLLIWLIAERGLSEREQRLTAILLWIILLPILAGCTADNSHLVQHSYTEEQHDEATGLTLHESQDMWVSFPEMVSIYVNTEACMGMHAPAPEVYFKSFVDYFNGAIGAVWGFHVKGTIYGNTDDYPDRPRSKTTDSQMLQHEYIHSILHYNTGDGDVRHASPMFGQCGRGVDVHN